MSEEYHLPRNPQPTPGSGSAASSPGDRRVFYEKVFAVAARVFPQILDRFSIVPGKEDETYQRVAREAVRAGEFLVLEFDRARSAGNPGAQR